MTLIIEIIEVKGGVEYTKEVTETSHKNLQENLLFYATVERYSVWSVSNPKIYLSPSETVMRQPSKNAPLWLQNDEISIHRVYIDGDVCSAP